MFCICHILLNLILLGSVLDIELLCVIFDANAVIDIYTITLVSASVSQIANIPVWSSISMSVQLTILLWSAEVQF